MRSARCGIETVSSATMIEPEPSIEPASAIASKVYGRSSSSSVSTGDEEPPGNQAFTRRPSAGPPARPKMSSRDGIPSSTS